MSTAINCVVNQDMILDEIYPKIHLSMPLAYDNAFAHAMRITAFDRDKNPADLTGVGVVGNFKRSNDTTVTPILGTVTGNVGEILLPPSCYVVPGRFTFTMNLTQLTDPEGVDEFDPAVDYEKGDLVVYDGVVWRFTADHDAGAWTGSDAVLDGITRSSMWVEGHVEKNISENIVDPGTPVGNIEQAIGNATAAATAAQSAATEASQAAAAAEQTVTNFAPAFVQGAANAAGTYVTYTDGKLYFLPDGHAAGATWANTTHTETNFGAEVSDLKSAIAHNSSLAKKYLDIVQLSSWENKIVSSVDPTYGRTNNAKAISTDLFTVPIAVDSVIEFHSYSSTPVSVLIARYDSNGNYIDSVTNRLITSGKYPLNVGEQIGLCLFANSAIDPSILKDITFEIRQESADTLNAACILAKGENNKLGFLKWAYYKNGDSNGNIVDDVHCIISRPYCAIYGTKVLVKNITKTSDIGVTIGTYTDSTGEAIETQSQITYGIDVTSTIAQGEYYFIKFYSNDIITIDDIISNFVIELMFDNSFPFIEYRTGFITNSGTVDGTTYAYTSSVIEGNSKRYKFESDGINYTVCILDAQGIPTLLKAYNSSDAEITFAIGSKYLISAGKSGGITLQDVQKISITEVSGGGGGSALAGTTIHFTTPVNCFKQDVSSDSLDLQDSVLMDNDYSVLMLPDTYNDDGEATRLIICCHGAGGTVTTDDSQIENNKTVQYLVANGYAVMDTNGLPFDYADTNGISRLNNVGSWLAMQCYIAAYHYVMEHYNLKKDGVFLEGASMGGITSTNLVMGGQLPVIAHGAFCPVLDTYNEIWLHPWSGGLPKVALSKLFDFPYENGQYVYSEEKVCGFNPVNNHTVTINNVKYTYYPCPVKFWHCDDDTTVNPEITDTFIQQIKNNGGRAYLRKLPTGGHEPQDAGNVLANPSGNTNYRGTTLQVKPAMEEMLIWFNRFN